MVLVRLGNPASDLRVCCETNLLGTREGLASPKGSICRCSANSRRPRPEITPIVALAIPPMVPMAAVPPEQRLRSLSDRDLASPDVTGLCRVGPCRCRRPDARYRDNWGSARQARWQEAGTVSGIENGSARDIGHATSGTRHRARDIGHAQEAVWTPSIAG